MHLALPFDLLTAETGLQELPPAAPQLIAPFATGALDRLAALLHAAQRPLVLAGPSAARWHARAACRQLEEAQDLRVIPMESPRGLKDPSLGALAAVIPDADLIVLAGKCLDFTLGFGGAAALGGQARVVVIDPDAAMLERAQRLLGERLALAVQGDAIAALSALRAAQPLAARAAWRARVDEALRYRGKPEPATSAGAALGPRVLCETVQAFLASAPDPVVVCDGGEFGQWAQAYCSAPVRIINGMSGPSARACATPSRPRSRGPGRRCWS